MFKKLLFLVALLFTATVVSACFEEEVEVQNLRVAIYDTAILDIVDAAGYDNFNIQALGVPHNLAKEHLAVYTETGRSIDLGSHTAVNYDNLVLLDPEVIILSSRYEQHRELITAAVPNARVYSGKFEYDQFYEGVLNNVEMLKEVFPNAASSIDAVFAPVNEAVLSLKNDTTAYNKSVLVLLANGNNIATYGLGGRFDMIYSTFGFKDALANYEGESFNGCDAVTHGCNISYEFFDGFNPDVVLIIDRANSVEGGTSASVTNLKNSEFFKATSAFINNDVYDLSSNAFYVNPGGVSSTITMINNLRQLLA